MTEQQIIDIFKTHFEVKLNQSKCDCGIDAKISLLADSQVCAYIIVKKNIQEERVWYDILRRIKEAGIIPTINAMPVVAVTEQSEKGFMGILTYCEFDKYYINRNISWKEMNTENIIWLAVQLRARRGSIRFLPPQLFRIEKIITLNSSSLLNGQVRYLRTFGEGYKIKKSEPSSPLGQFNRNVFGTPEEDYPQDVLDDIIFNAVKEVYPEAKLQSSTILFDSDLLNRRIIKDAKMESQKIYALDKSTNTQKPIATLEVYYYYNVWKASKVREIIPIIECDNREDLERLINVINARYEPLSRLNI